MKKEESLFKNVKSNYILKKIFSFLEKHKELLVINNNKIIQNQLNDNIEDYKKASQIYKEIEKKWNGKRIFNKR